MKTALGNFLKFIEQGKKDFAVVKEINEKNRSPTPKPTLTKQQILNKITFCQRELKIHRENLNNVMIGYKTAEIKDLEKKLN